MIEIGIMVALIILASALAKAIKGGPPKRLGRGAVVQQVASADRQKALQVYENLCREKLEVIKTALAMGYSQEDLARLDARLERLIGKDELQKLSRGETPVAGAELVNLSLADEERTLQRLRVAG